MDSALLGAEDEINVPIALSAFRDNHNRSRERLVVFISELLLALCPGVTPFCKRLGLTRDGVR